MRSFLYLLIMGGVVYFGWSYFEALLIVLPIPDPKDIKEKLAKLFGGSTDSKSQKPNAKAGGYT